MTFHYRDEDYLRGVFAVWFDIVSVQQYTEMEDDDSVYVIARVSKTA